MDCLIVMELAAPEPIKGGWERAAKTRHGRPPTCGGFKPGPDPRRHVHTKPLGPRKPKIEADMRLEYKRYSLEEIQGLAKSFAPRALWMLAKFVEDEEISAGQRIQAAGMLLARGYGNTPQHASIDIKDERKQASKISLAAMDAQIRERFSQLIDLAAWGKLTDEDAAELAGIKAALEQVEGTGSRLLEGTSSVDADVPRETSADGAAQHISDGPRLAW